MTQKKPSLGRGLNALMGAPDPARPVPPAGTGYSTPAGPVGERLARLPLDILQRESGIDLLVVDFAMPGMNGAEVARLAHARQPNLPVLFVTGFADRGGLAGVDDAYIVCKPFHYDELAGKVQFALGAGRIGNVVQLRR